MKQHFMVWHFMELQFISGHCFHLCHRSVSKLHILQWFAWACRITFLYKICLHMCFHDLHLHFLKSYTCTCTYGITIMIRNHICFHNVHPHCLSIFTCACNCLMFQFVCFNLDDKLVWK
jgi:hypothetical protein